MAAFGDETQRKGTPGIMAPETMNERRTPCRANQDVFAMAHMLLLVVAKDGIKRDNLFMHEVGVVKVKLNTSKTVSSRGGRSIKRDDLLLHDVGVVKSKLNTLKTFFFTRWV